MATYMIGYRLDNADQDCPGLVEAIKRLADRCWNNLDRTWIINHSGTASSIRDALKPHVDADVGLLVVKVSSEDAWADFEGRRIRRQGHPPGKA